MATRHTGHVVEAFVHTLQNWCLQDAKNVSKLKLGLSRNDTECTHPQLSALFLGRS